MAELRVLPSLRQETQEDIIRALEDMLKLAKEVPCQGVAIALLRFDGSTNTYVSKSDDALKMLGVMTNLLFRVQLSVQATSPEEDPPAAS